jgi:hypothetical protein
MLGYLNSADEKRWPSRFFPTAFRNPQLHPLIIFPVFR